MSQDKTESQISLQVFEKKLKEVGEIVEVLESESSSLEETIIAWERGTLLIRQLQVQLSSAEQRIGQIIETVH